MHGHLDTDIERILRCIYLLVGLIAGAVGLLDDLGLTNKHFIG